jgi:hypothetical protein
MDRHDVPGSTAEDVAEAHRKDVEIQDKYGVRYMTYWHDAERGTGFCLVDAPDAATAAHVPTAASSSSFSFSIPTKGVETIWRRSCAIKARPGSQPDSDQAA